LLPFGPEPSAFQFIIQEYSKTKKNKMGKECSTYVGEKHTGFSWGKLREGDHMENLGVNG